MTVQQFITSVLRLIGVVAAGQTPNVEESNDSLDVLNNMLAEWETQHLAVYTIVNRQYWLAPGTGTYTMGTGGVFNANRPVKIESAGILQTNGLRSPLDLITSKDYAVIPEKSVQAVQPLKLYNDNDYPLAKLYLWPVPKVMAQIDLDLWEQVSGTLALVDTIDFPPGYLKALRFNLAVDLCSEFGRPLDQTIAQKAAETKAELAGLNVSNQAAQEDPPPPPRPVQ